MVIRAINIPMDENDVELLKEIKRVRQFKGYHTLVPTMIKEEAKRLKIIK